MCYIFCTFQEIFLSSQVLADCDVRNCLSSSMEDGAKPFEGACFPRHSPQDSKLHSHHIENSDSIWSEMTIRKSYSYELKEPQFVGQSSFPRTIKH